MSHRNRVVIVTGTTGSLGEALTKAYLEAEAIVVGTYREEKHARRLEEAVGPMKERLELHQLDLTKASAVDRLLTSTRDHLGHIDALVNAAGAFKGGTPVHEGSAIDLEAMIAANLKTAYLCSRAVIPFMLARGRGRIVNVAAKPALGGTAHMAAYGAAKAAVVNLTEALADELRAQGICVNCIVPSIIDTARNRQDMPEGPHELWAKPEEIARVVLFLTSDEAAVVSGAAIPVYGRAG
jgi:NAD(P)-dependent dehydrogenase (short-subunit alcohol dehydrogenase family)